MQGKKLLVAGLSGALVTVRLLSGCVGDSSLSSVDTADGSTEASSAEGGSKPNGGACTVGGDCTSGFCADQVCCNSACSGSCEKCNLGGAQGTCTAIPAGEDPDTECKPGALPEAGADPQDGAPTLNVPEAGMTLTESNCNGSCNGKRACAYPDSKTSCGTGFCNTLSTQGRASCDGVGHCGLGLESCAAYACPDGTEDGGAVATGCLSACTSDNDCLSTHYCDNGACKGRLANGTACTSTPQCQSGNCIQSVCCNDTCAVAGGSCISAGKVGQCTCPACATGPCTQWYPDKDGDGFGDPTGAPVFGCLNGVDGGLPAPPQAGYVLDKTDCFDAVGAVGASVHPGQSGYFSAGYGSASSFDYNCDNTETKLHPVDLAGTCGFCSSAPLCTEVSGNCPTATSPVVHLCGKSVKICNDFGSHSAFHANVLCGGSDTLYNCGFCSFAGALPTKSTSTPNVVQTCH